MAISSLGKTTIIKENDRHGFIVGMSVSRKVGGYTVLYVSDGHIGQVLAEVNLRNCRGGRMDMNFYDGTNALRDVS